MTLLEFVDKNAGGLAVVGIVVLAFAYFAFCAWLEARVEAKRLEKRGGPRT